MKLKIFFYKILLMFFLISFIAEAYMYNRKNIISVTMYNFFYDPRENWSAEIIIFPKVKFTANLLLIENTVNCNSFYCPTKGLYFVRNNINDFLPDVFLTKSFYVTPENADNYKSELEICFTDGSCNRWNRESFPQQFHTLYNDMQVILMNSDDLPDYRFGQLHTKAIFDKKDLTEVNIYKLSAYPFNETLLYKITKNAIIKYANKICQLTNGEIQCLIQNNETKYKGKHDYFKLFPTLFLKGSDFSDPRENGKDGYKIESCFKQNDCVIWNDHSPGYKGNEIKLFTDKLDELVTEKTQYKFEPVVMNK